MHIKYSGGLTFRTARLTFVQHSVVMISILRPGTSRQDMCPLLCLTRGRVQGLHVILAFNGRGWNMAQRSTVQFAIRHLLSINCCTIEFQTLILTATVSCAMP